MTGASNGIGLNFVRKTLAKGGFTRVILAARSPARCAETLGALTGGGPVADPSRPVTVNGAVVEALPCDLGSLASAESFAAAVTSRVAAIHLLVLNAGVVCGSGLEPTATRTVDGYEMTFQTNHLSHFLLVNAFEAQLKRAGAAGGARVVVTASHGHRAAAVARGGRDVAAWREAATVLGRCNHLVAYCDSKLANVLHAREIHKRWAGQGVTANSLHPGAIRETGIWAAQRGFVSFLIDWVALPLGRLVGQWQSVDDGGDAIAACADPAEAGGRYRYISRWEEPSATAREEGVATALWEASDALLREAAAARGAAAATGKGAAAAPATGGADPAAPAVAAAAATGGAGQ